MRKILHTFAIPGRGTGVIVDRRTDHPPKQVLLARICRPDGSWLEASATREHTQFRGDDDEAADRDTFFLRGVAQKDVPARSSLEMIT
ncbi:hypothetical protein ACFW16_33025 [Inquilinus sp. NPDC058860]|uniref:hypothetical protein n=1 Tax=Inquilinus sp. NPDC058860 TaxID=3346652 RepID=UPI0036D041C4